LARLTGVAAQAAVALENARLLEVERAGIARIRETDKLKSEFLSVVSHELRTPLSVMLGAIRTLQWRRDSLTPEIADDLVDSIVRRGEELDHLVNDLIAASGDIDLDVTDVDLAAVARSSVADHQALHPEREMCAECANPVDVQADAPRVREIIDILLDNASKHAPGARVQVDAGIAGTEGWVSVCDDGPGMTPEQTARAFEPFWQGDSSTVRRVGGMGLEAHGGRIWIESSAEKGLCVRFAMPIGGPPISHIIDEADDAPSPTTEGDSSRL
jgi:signal transduction histidine kinase